MILSILNYFIDPIQIATITDQFFVIRKGYVHGKMDTA